MPAMFSIVFMPIAVKDFCFSLDIFKLINFFDKLKLLTQIFVVHEASFVSKKTKITANT
jgi:hypothetical protein